MEMQAATSTQQEILHTHFAKHYNMHNPAERSKVHWCLKSQPKNNMCNNRTHRPQKTVSSKLGKTI
eukprot:5913864-Ditylum_brightwellii.AAC.1